MPFQYAICALRTFKYVYYSILDTPTTNFPTTTRCTHTHTHTLCSLCLLLLNSCVFVFGLLKTTLSYSMNTTFVVELGTHSLTYALVVVVAVVCGCKKYAAVAEGRLWHTTILTYQQLLCATYIR